MTRSLRKRRRTDHELYHRLGLNLLKVNETLRRLYLCSYRSEPRKNCPTVDHAGREAPTRRHELGHRDHTDGLGHEAGVGVLSDVLSEGVDDREVSASGDDPTPLTVTVLTCQRFARKRMYGRQVGKRLLYVALAGNARTAWAPDYSLNDPHVSAQSGSL